MNKRQHKKRKRKIEERYNFLFRNGETPIIARQFGKTGLYLSIYNIIQAKQYKDCKAFKKSRKDIL